MAIQKLQYIDSCLVEKMTTLLPRQSPEELQNRFGIGVNTWVKIRKGQAIRESVATRLIQRLEGYC